MLKKRRTRDMLILIVGFIGLVAINKLASVRFGRLDMTSEKRYSLSDSTKQMLRNLDDNVYFRVYLEGDNLNARYKKLRNSIRETLDEFAAYSKGNVSYEFIDPFGDPDPAQQDALQQELIDAGLVPTTDTEVSDNSLSRQNIYPGAIAVYKGQEIPVSFLQSEFVQSDEFQINQSIQNLEYELSAAIFKLRNIGQRKKIAFSFGHGEAEDKYLMDLLFGLKDFYALERVEIKNDLDVLNSTHKVLVVADPDSAFDDAGRFILDQYVMNGGRILWLIDPVKVDLDSLETNNFTFSREKPLGIEDMLFKWGARYNYDLIMDAECAPIQLNVGYQGNQPKYQMFPWYYFPVLLNDSVTHPIAKNANGLKLELASSLDTSKVPGVKKTILLRTSKLTKLMRSGSRVALNVVEAKPTPAQFKYSYVPVSVLLEGSFTSIFENRIVELADRKVILKSPETKMIVVTDGDIIRNKFIERTKTPMPLGLDPQTGIYYGGNKTFLLNSINYLADDGWFVALRAKEFKIRPLDKEKVRQNQGMVRALNIAVPVTLILLFGLVYNFIRRKKYA